MKASKKNRPGIAFLLSRPSRSLPAGLLALAFAAAILSATAPPLSVQALNGAVSHSIVISQVYGGGGNSMATYNQDFIELLNTSLTPIDVSNWSVQYQTQGGTTWAVVNLCSSTGAGTCTILPGRFFLVGLDKNAASTAANLPASDAPVSSLNIAASQGKIALVNSRTSLPAGSAVCASLPVTGDPSVMDFVGYGTMTNPCFEGAGAASGPGNNTTSLIRASNTDTDDNSNDFQVLAVNPRNSASSPIAPTAVTLASFRAIQSSGGVLLKWRTGFEVDNIGFNIYRVEDGKRTRINPSPIAGSALLAGQGTALGAGRSYCWIDRDAKDDAQYLLEDLDLGGHSGWHGPVEAGPATEALETPGPGSRGAVLLSDVGKRAIGANASTRPVERRAELANSQAGANPFASKLRGRSAIKISIREEGYYALSGEELVRAGLDPGIDPRLIELYADGVSQPINISGQADGRLDPADKIEFYGVGLESASTEARTYWLAESASAGRRIKKEKGRGRTVSATGFLHTVERKDRVIYFSSLRNGEAENFFGTVVSSDPVDQAVMLENLAGHPPAEASVEILLQGVTADSHRVQADLNGVVLGEVVFTGQMQGRMSLQIPQGSLREGENKVRLMAKGGDLDVSLLDSIRIGYWRSYRAAGGALRFTLSDNQKAVIDGFSRSDIRVIDVTDPDDAQEVKVKVQARGIGYAIKVEPANPGRRLLLAFTGDQIKRPASVRADRPSGWREPDNEADFVIIAHQSLLSELEPLARLRESEGLSVAVVDIEDLYDEFIYGQKSPQAVKEFLVHARGRWKKAPEFVLLVGDASLDPKNYLGQGEKDLVPTRLIDTRLMETASDDWFVDFDGDGLAEMAIGRLPALTRKQAASMVSKLTSYGAGASLERALLVSDSGDGYDFAQASSLLLPLLPGGMEAEQISRDGVDDRATKSYLLEKLKGGKLLVNYMGHGSLDLWRGNLLSSDDADSLAQTGHPSIFVAMTCLNGYFQDATIESLAESLMKVEGGGAIAVWASAGMCEPSGQALLNQQFYLTMFGEKKLRLGQAVVQAKAAVNDRDMRRTWILFADPTLMLR